MTITFGSICWGCEHFRGDELAFECNHFLNLVDPINRKDPNELTHNGFICPFKDSEKIKSLEDEVKTLKEKLEKLEN